MTNRPPAPPARGRGRRPGGTDTRAAIIGAARKSFAEKGYDRSSLRGIARDAGVDPALIHHYFDGGKSALFVATLSVPIAPATLVDGILDGPPHRLGWRVIETFLTVWDPPERRDTLVALLRTSMSSDEGARMLREFLGREIFGRIASATGVDDPALRGSLAASQVIGLAMMRYVIKAPTIVALSDAQVVERLGPVLQHHLVDSTVVEG